MYIGIDASRPGWVFAFKGKKGTTLNLFKYLEDGFATLLDIERVFIDMPIGAVDAKNFPRASDRDAKQQLGHRGSTFFYTPPIEIINGEGDYYALNALAKQLTGKGLSKQSYYLLPKIRELRLFLATHGKLRPFIFESHPELCFAAFNRDCALMTSKHNVEGIEDRLKILAGLGVGYSKDELASIRKSFSLRDLDDIIDALILALAASADDIELIPDNIVVDRSGLTCNIAIPRCSTVRD
jgi:predicted RNase H-like nuclease